MLFTASDFVEACSKVKTPSKVDMEIKYQKYFNTRYSHMMNIAITMGSKSFGIVVEPLIDIDITEVITNFNLGKGWTRNGTIPTNVSKIMYNSDGTFSFE